MDELSKRLRAAQGDAVPRRDLWPGVEKRIRTPRVVRWQHAAAAVLLFGAGTFAGTLLERAGAGTVTGSADAAPASPLHVATAVQRAGTDYVAAVARLRELGAADEVLRVQGYEAALSVLSVTVEEVTSALDLHEHQALVGQANEARAAASRRVIALVEGGNE